MARRESNLQQGLAELDRQLTALRGQASSAVLPAIDRVRHDVGSLQFQLQSGSHRPSLLAIVGGTGTGKSTLVNRLLKTDVTATSFRRTFTAGAVAAAQSSDAIPRGWLGLDPVFPTRGELPARGQADALAIVPVNTELTQRTTLIDTPDLDGDQPLHHAQADRVFRWAQAVLFLVTPEKYQMTELVPYYRMAARYALPALFVMNKAEEQAVVEDYRRVLAQFVSPMPAQMLFAIPRDGGSFEPPAEMNLDALRHSIQALEPAPEGDRQRGIAARSADLTDRLRDQVIEPLRRDRDKIDRLTQSLRAFETPEASVDVNPLTRQLQRRLQQRSVLYLMGPGRMLDRVRQVPMLLARLPRSTWDLLRHGELRGDPDDIFAKDGDRGVPNFNALLVDQFAVVQSRIDDVLRSNPSAEGWLNQNNAEYSAARIDPASAGRIADEEIADLRSWLENRWHATPRDTALFKKILKVIPGGQKLADWSEAAPYLLALVVATHHAFFGPVDLMVIGGFSLATWLTERLSNEVASRTRLTNQHIARRFGKLAHEQIEKTCAWLEKQSPPSKALDALQELADRVSEPLAVK